MSCKSHYVCRVNIYSYMQCQEFLKELYLYALEDFVHFKSLKLLIFVCFKNYICFIIIFNSIIKILQIISADINIHLVFLNFTNVNFIIDVFIIALWFISKFFFWYYIFIYFNKRFIVCAIGLGRFTSNFLYIFLFSFLILKILQIFLHFKLNFIFHYANLWITSFLLCYIISIILLIFLLWFCSISKYFFFQFNLFLYVLILNKDFNIDSRLLEDY